MKHFALYIIILYSIFSLTACRDRLVPPEEDPASSGEVLQPKAEAERTVIIYMAADNNLTEIVRGDTAEMIKGKGLIPENVNFVIYLDDNTHKPALYELSAKNGMKKLKESDEEHCSTDGETMLKVLREIQHYFPARHYSITFWSHASGWVPKRNTFGVDVTPGTTTKEQEMEIPVLRDVLSQLPKLDYIFFDACFMQCIEVAYELRHCADWMIGSPAEIPGPGAPYDKIMKALCEGDAKGIEEGYDNGYPGTYNGDSIYTGVLLSCIDLSELEPLAQATGRLITPFYMNQTQPSTYGFQPYCNNWWRPHLTKYTYCFDMRTTMRRLLSEEDYTSWMEHFDRAVPIRTYSSRTWLTDYLCDNPYIEDTTCYGGVSMFMPMKEYEPYGWNGEFQKTSWYAATGWQETGW